MKRRYLALTMALALEGCAGLLHPPPPNPAIAADAARVGTDARAFFAALATKTAPDCSFAANSASYDTLKAEVATLRARVAAGDTPMAQAIDALGQTVDGAAHAHDLASQRTDDANGVCMAPGAISLNVDAVGRAADAVVMLERKREGL